MRQAGLLVASFIVTLTVLSGGFFVLQAVNPPTPTPAPTVAPTAAAPTAAPTARAATPAPTAAPTAASLPAASVGPTGKIQVVVLGSEYVNADVGANGTLTRGNGGVITFTTDRTISAQLEIDWEMPASAIPPGFTLRSVDVRICGSGTGDFWETYGPTGSNPDEAELTRPAADGCWHYEGAPGPDTTVRAIIRLASTMTITRLEYTATVSK